MKRSASESRARRLRVLLAQLGRQPGAREEPEVPVLGMVQVGEASRRERAHEVQRERRVRVGVEQRARIGASRVGRELGAIDEIAEVARQDDAAALLGRLRARLRVLAGEAPDAHDRLLAGVDEHHRHLQEDLQLVRDDRRACSRAASRRSRRPGGRSACRPGPRRSTSSDARPPTRSRAAAARRASRRRSRARPDRRRRPLAREACPSRNRSSRTSGTA